MKFTCEKAILSETLEFSSRAVSSKSTIPALEGLLLEVSNGILAATGYDLEVGIRAASPVSVSETGTVILNARLITDIVKKLPDGPVTVETDEKLFTTITCGPSIFNLIGLPASEFPELPSVQTEHTTAIPQSILRAMIAGTIFSASENENRPILTGCRFSLQEKALEVAALDNFRVAIRREEVDREPGSPDLSFVVPAKALREIERLIGDSDDPVEISLSRRHIQFVFRGITLTSRLLEGEFLNYENAIPKASPVVYTAQTAMLVHSLERVSLIINEKLKNYVKCSFSKDMLQLSCTTAVGRAYDECPVRQDEGGDLDIGFNSRYLLEALRACKADDVRLELNTPLSPLLIRPTEGDSFLYLVLPVRLKNDA